MARKAQSKAACNERRKAVAALFNTLSVALMVAALFQPISTGRLPGPALLAAALLGFVVFQWGSTLCTWQTGGLSVDPLLYAILVLGAAGALVGIGGLISMWRNR